MLGRGSFDTTLTPPRTQSCIKRRATRAIAGEQHAFIEAVFFEIDSCKMSTAGD